MLGVRPTAGLPRSRRKPIFERDAAGLAGPPGQTEANPAGNTSKPALGPYRWASRLAGMGLRRGLAAKFLRPSRVPEGRAREMLAD
jgi:hypothetical protein